MHFGNRRRRCLMKRLRCAAVIRRLLVSWLQLCWLGACTTFWRWIAPATLFGLSAVMHNMINTNIYTLFTSPDTSVWESIERARHSKVGSCTIIARLVTGVLVRLIEKLIYSCRVFFCWDSIVDVCTWSVLILDFLAFVILKLFLF